MSEALQKQDAQEDNSSGGVIKRLSSAYRILRRQDDLARVNPLQIYEPHHQIKSLVGEIPFEQSGSNIVPVYSSWAEWDTTPGGRYSNANIDYASRIGNLWQSSLVMSAVRWLGNTLPEPPLQVKETNDNKGESEVVANHPLVDLWHTPNPFYSGSTLSKGVAFSWVLKGDVYIRKVWNKGKTGIAELWYEPHWLIRPRWLRDGLGAYIPKSMSFGNADGQPDDPMAFINYYEVDRNGYKYRLEVSDIIHLRSGFDPVNQRCGMSGLGSILREIYGDNEAANYYALLMGGSGVPKFVLSVDANLNDEQRRGLQDDLERRTKGEYRGRPLVVQGGKVEKLSFSPKDLDLSDTRLMAEDRFAAITGIPAVVLELAAGRKNSIYNNVKSAMERAIDSFCVPLWRHMAEEFTVQLLPDFETAEKSLSSIKSYVSPIRTDYYQQIAVKATRGQMRYVTHDLSKVRALQEDEDAKHRRVNMDYRNGIIDRYMALSDLGREASEEDRGIRYPNTSSKGGEALPMATGQTDGQVKSNGHDKQEQRIIDRIEARKRVRL